MPWSRRAWEIESVMLFSVVAAIVCWGGVAWASWRLASSLLRDENMATRWTGAGIIGISFIVLVLEILGSIGLLYVGPAIAASLAFMLLAAKRPCPIRPADDAQSLVAWLRKRLQDGYGLLFCIAALPLVQAVMRGLRSPPLSWDSLEYHAFFPARWVQLGSLASFAAPTGMDTCRAHPINCELLVAWALLPFHGDLFINMVNIPVMLMAGVAMYALARTLKAPPAIAVWAPAIFCFSPPMWLLVTTQYADILGVATTLAGLLFLLRYIADWRPRDLLFAAAGLGLATGTRHSGLPLAGLCVGGLAIVMITRRTLHMRSLALLGLGALIFSATGVYQYVRNWIEIGNPVYPAGLSLGGTTILELSPHHAEIFRRLPFDHQRAADWNHFKGLFASGQYSWGVVYLLILPAAIVAALRPGRQRAEQWLLAMIMTAIIAGFYAPGSGLAAHIRRLWPTSSMRLLAPAMAIAVCLSIVTLSKLRWPPHLLAVLPTLLVLASVWCGCFPQPLSFGEAAVVVIAVVAACWLLSAKFPERLIKLTRPGRAVIACAAVAVFISATAGVTLLQARREAARYHHYESSIDYHDIPREFVPAWQACDEPGRPHIVAVTRNRSGTEKLSIVSTATRWLLYPLLGPQLQNQVVYASIHELRDLPTRPFLSGLREDGDEGIWLKNLQRLQVDRLFVGEQTKPEEAWVAARPNVFTKISQGEGYALYRVSREGVARAIAECGFVSQGVARAEDCSE